MCLLTISYVCPCTVSVFYLLPLDAIPRPVTDDPSVRHTVSLDRANPHHRYFFPHSQYPVKTGYVWGKSHSSMCSPFQRISPHGPGSTGTRSGCRCSLRRHLWHTLIPADWDMNFRPQFGRMHLRIFFMIFPYDGLSPCNSISSMMAVSIASIIARLSRAVALTGTSTPCPAHLYDPSSSWVSMPG